MDHETYNIITAQDPSGKEVLEKRIATSNHEEIEQLTSICQDPGTLADDPLMREALRGLWHVLKEYGYL